MLWRPPAPFHSGLIITGASAISREPTRFRAGALLLLMDIELPKSGFSRKGLGVSLSLIDPGVAEGGFPLSPAVGSPEYSSHRTEELSGYFDPLTALGSFQNFLVVDVLGRGKLLLYLLEPDEGKSGVLLVEGLGVADMGETSELTLLARLRPPIWLGDSGGETSSG